MDVQKQLPLTIYAEIILARYLYNKFTQPHAHLCLLLHEHLKGTIKVYWSDCNNVKLTNTKIILKHWQESVMRVLHVDSVYKKDLQCHLYLLYAYASN